MWSILPFVDAAALGLVVATVMRRAYAARRPAPQVLFVDCDDCVYQNGWATAQKITTSIAAYTAKIGVSKEKAYALYQTHGTCLKGLLVEGLIDDQGVEDYLREVHLIDYSDIDANPLLRSELARLRVPTWIFTASTSEHAGRCLARVGLDDLPWRGIIDCRSCSLETKYALPA